MKALFAFLTLFFSVNAANLRLLKDEIRAQIINVNDLKVEFKILDPVNYPLKKGEIGIVVHKYKNETAVIAEVAFVSNESAQIKEASILKQPFLPSFNTPPKAGDIIVFRFQNHKAFLIAPNFEAFSNASKKLQGINVLSSDLLQGALFSYGGFDPNRKFLTQTCANYEAGILFIAFKNHLSAFDCKSFVHLGDEALEFKDKAIQAPFYSRIGSISSDGIRSFFTFRLSTDYYNFYAKLIKN